jgi:hypothetical protein
MGAGYRQQLQWLMTGTVLAWAVALAYAQILTGNRGCQSESFKCWLPAAYSIMHGFVAYGG